jgi:hypothetical protein
MLRVELVVLVLACQLRKREGDNVTNERVHALVYIEK